MRDPSGVIARDRAADEPWHLRRADLLADIADGYFGQISAGYDYDLRSDAELIERPGDVPLLRVHRWLLTEGSLVPVGADPNSFIRSLQGSPASSPVRSADAIKPQEKRSMDIEEIVAAAEAAIVAAEEAIAAAEEAASGEGVADIAERVKALRGTRANEETTPAAEDEKPTEGERAEGDDEPTEAEEKEVEEIRGIARSFGLVDFVNVRAALRAKSIVVPHYEQPDAIMANEVVGVRAFGSEVDFETVQRVLNEKQTDMVSRLNRTLNFAKAAMIQGYLFDADGSVYYNWFDELGFSRNEFEFDIEDANIKIRDVAIALKRRSEAKLGGYTYSRFVWLCPPEMFDAIVAHPSVKEAYERWQDGANLRADNRKGFLIADNVEIRSYEINNTGAFDTDGNPVRMFPSTKSYFVPDTKSLFQVRYAPADNMHAVNTIGQAYYAASAPMDFDKGVKLLTESNFVVYSEKPDAIVEVSFA